MEFIDSGEYIRGEQNKTLPPIPLQTVILINGEPYDFIFGQDSSSSKRMTTPWTVWKQLWRANASLDSYFMTWFPQRDKTQITPLKVDRWHWQGITEVFSIQESGCCLKDLYIHAGEYVSDYMDFRGVKPKSIHENPLVMHYPNIMLKCIEYFKGRVLLGHGRKNNILNKYDCIIEIELKDGRLKAAQDVTQLVKDVKQWLMKNPAYTMEQLNRQFPRALTERQYWFQ